ncbi:MBL fold metallo-hydrolase [Laribacter hongkongensis]|uniref:MBL fold metallo-hydrolase n=1 Tax=Laribacter hongkongensis TaxID=168471 RepID=UPI001EFC846B|nr:MBL fold metallo-hydrolase [Laribacter hongkongensis]MCG9059724.1 MBL fold metallo-hydrolase [Laribacter hongkongensis]MCG9086665.1 MBL fold metallo-hydrolase [Laribacter hongkongensis]MCG9098104.1 MBL fold metallo-hydrolase [Laribacter hongkongensis]
MTTTVTILGCGSSSGTPAIGCQCPTCTSDDPKNRRTRASSLVSVDGVHLLIDTGPDLRQQALRERLTRVDAVLYTHPHADHLNGIDDLRAFCYLKKGPITLYGNRFMLDNIRDRFGYCLLPPGQFWDKPVLHLEEAVPGVELEAAGVKVEPVAVEHGRWQILGWRIGRMAYLTDVSCIPEASFARLEGLDLLLLDCLKYASYPSHFGVEQALAAAARIGARRTVLIHMTHELEYHTLAAQCPPGVEPGFDGMRLTLD